MALRTVMVTVTVTEHWQVGAVREGAALCESLPVLPLVVGKSVSVEKLVSDVGGAQPL
jgi:hypothetical protein